ncbi:MAG TPA: archaellin/type IV pilin N-terminal domain-containing protein [Candidatus Angelobacter sp.]|nr:archaellin/type IV pilin N-terminal domain-containing protein [Candidatus Angelobacter sp.]
MRTIKNIRRYVRERKGINTILAALLMVVIVVVAAVMVYAWSTGLLSSLLVQNPVPKESLNLQSSAFGNGTTVTLYLGNSGSASVSLQTYYVKDSNGNVYTQSSWSPAAIAPNAAQATTIYIGANCSTCTLSGSAFTFTAGYSYTVTVVTTRNNQFAYTLTR